MHESEIFWGYKATDPVHRVVGRRTRRRYSSLPREDSFPDPLYALREHDCHKNQRSHHKRILIGVVFLELKTRGVSDMR